MLVAVLCCACFALHAAGAPTLLAGVAEVDGTLPVGVPLAGYNHGDRRAEYWPVPNNTAYTSFMTPSVGVMDPTHIRCLALRQGQKEYVVSEKAFWDNFSLNFSDVFPLYKSNSLINFLYWSIFVITTTSL